MVNGEGIVKDYDPSLRKAINSGYIIIPEDVDRDQFIEQCLRIKRFSVLVEGGGGVMHNCYVTKSALRDIQFPEEGATLGSAVVFFGDPFSGKVIITDVVEKDDETELDQPDIMMWKRRKGENYAILTINGNGEINLDVTGVSRSGKVNINVTNDDATAEVNMHVKGSVNVYAEGPVNIHSVDGDVTVSSKENVNIRTTCDVNVESTRDIYISNDDGSVTITDSGVNIESTKGILVGGQCNVLYSLVPDASAILDVKEIGVSQKVKVGA